MQKARTRSPRRSNNILDRVPLEQNFSSLMLSLLHYHVVQFVLNFLVSHGAWNSCLNNTIVATHPYGPLLGSWRSLWSETFISGHTSWPGPIQARYLLAVSRQFTRTNIDSQFLWCQSLNWYHLGYRAYLREKIEECLASWIASAGNKIFCTQNVKTTLESFKLEYPGT